MRSDMLPSLVVDDPRDNAAVDAIAVGDGLLRETTKGIDPTDLGDISFGEFVLGVGRTFGSSFSIGDGGTIGLVVDMFPSRAVGYADDDRQADTISLGDGCEGEFGVEDETMDLRDLFIGELGRSMQLSTMMEDSMSSLGHGVPDIVALTSEPEVSWIAAEFVVARVANASAMMTLPSGDGTIGDDPSKTMGPIAFILGNMKTSIAIGEGTCGPSPTSIGVATINMTPEPVDDILCDLHSVDIILQKERE
jgi:hypothetical protein